MKTKRTKTKAHTRRRSDANRESSGHGHSWGCWVAIGAVALCAACGNGNGGGPGTIVPGPGDPKEASRHAGIACAEFADAVARVQYFLFGLGSGARHTRTVECFDVEIPGLTAEVCIDPDAGTLTGSASGGYSARGVNYQLELSLNGTYGPTESEFEWTLHLQGVDGTEMSGTGDSTITVDPATFEVLWTDTGEAIYRSDCEPVVDLGWDTHASVIGASGSGQSDLQLSVSTGYDATMIIDLSDLSGSGAVVRDTEVATIILAAGGTLRVEHSDGSVETDPDGGC